MRALLFALMIVLLPLRGWMNDAMATGIALAHPQHSQHSQFATKLIVDSLHETGAQTYFSHEAGAPVAVQDAQAADDCAGHSPDHPSHAINAGCDSCAVCQVCHTPSLAAVAVVDSSAVLSARAPRPAAATSFASADAALGQKPPIF